MIFSVDTLADVLWYWQNVHQTRVYYFEKQISSFGGRVSI